MAVAADRLEHGENPELVRALALWPRSRPARAARRALQALLLIPLVRLLCRPLRVEGAKRLAAGKGPVVFVANHASHADTAVILAALPGGVRRLTAPAAASDYFFRGRARGALAALSIGAFPFPRRGTAGLARAEALLARGWNVLLFPEGTRTTDGHMRAFRPGAGALAARGATIVPVGISGTREVLPKGGRLPRRRPVAVVFGEPERFGRGTPSEVVAQQLARRVSRLRAAARLLRPPASPSHLERVGTVARSPAGLWIAFAWGVAEALIFPIVPDVPVALMAAAAPSRFLPLATAAVAGSLAGGAAAYGLGALGLGSLMLAHAPLVTQRMTGHALGSLGSAGAAALLGQPWTGIPYKVFAYQASGAGVAAGPFLAWSLVGRGHRILPVAAVFAAAWWPLHRWTPRLARRLYVPFAFSFLVVFALGLGRVVSAWS
jgi:1-acyl-sn-glycerol-3-phosphate acyltransferase/membrane protein YqaA with SNARE-associated domain